VVFLAIGIVLLVLSGKVVEIEQRYDEKCVKYKIDNPKAPGDPDINTCWVDLKDIPEPGLTGPIYVYYQMNNFY